MAVAQLFAPEIGQPPFRVARKMVTLRRKQSVTDVDWARTIGAPASCQYLFAARMAALRWLGARLQLIHRKAICTRLPRLGRERFGHRSSGRL